jgi:hypothetical protein
MTKLDPLDHLQPVLGPRWAQEANGGQYFGSVAWLISWVTFFCYDLGSKASGVAGAHPPAPPPLRPPLSRLPLPQFSAIAQPVAAADFIDQSLCGLHPIMEITNRSANSSSTLSPCSAIHSLSKVQQLVASHTIGIPSEYGSNNGHWVRCFYREPGTPSESQQNMAFQRGVRLAWPVQRGVRLALSLCKLFPPRNPRR